MTHRTLQRSALVLALLFSGAAFADNLAPRDQAFLEQAAQNGHAEQSASQLALTKARNPQVKAFAQRMVDEHARLGNELETLAASKTYTPPKEASLMQKGKEALIGGLSDETFDQRYVNQMGVEAHEANVRLFEEAARETRDPDVKAFAVKHLPALRNHLQAARELKATVDPAPTTSGSR
jgi:putative membrane protein